MDVLSGNFRTFNARQALGPERVMASGALPPGLPMVRVEGGCYYWDGSLLESTRRTPARRDWLEMPPEDPGILGHDVHREAE